MEALIRRTFVDEAHAPKPGNVSPDSPGHGMDYADFTQSALAASPPLADPRLCVGERILRAVRQTRASVGCNTNLGMLLLFAPLAAAAGRTGGMGGIRALRVELGHVLAALDAHDGDCIYTAIREAAPGGLGDSTRYDVHTTPAGTTVLAAMHHARRRDRIARQYVSTGEDIFGLGVPRMLHHRRQPCREEAFRDPPLDWTLAACYIDFLAAFPDSHVLRRHGPHTAAWLRGEADALKVALECDRVSYPRRSVALDRRLKRAGINPGTSADLTAASLLACRLAGLLV